MSKLYLLKPAMVEEAKTIENEIIYLAYVPKDDFSFIPSKGLKGPKDGIHRTLSYKPTIEEMAEIINSHASVATEVIIGYGYNGKNEGLFLRSGGHFTVGVAQDSKAVLTGKLPIVYWEDGSKGWKTRSIKTIPEIRQGATADTVRKPAWLNDHVSVKLMAYTVSGWKDISVFRDRINACISKYQLISEFMDYMQNAVIKYIKTHGVEYIEKNGKIAIPWNIVTETREAAYAEYRAEEDAKAARWAAEAAARWAAKELAVNAGETIQLWARYTASQDWDEEDYVEIEGMMEETPLGKFICKLAEDTDSFWKSCVDHDYQDHTVSVPYGDGTLELNLHYGT